MSKGRVIVVGSSNTDLVVRCNRLPRVGETALGGDLLTFAGGKGANQAVAAARAGAQVLFVGAFGDDAFGQARRKDLERENVDCTGCVTKKGVPSGVALIALGNSTGKGSSAENLIVVAPGANARLTPNDVVRAMPRNLDDQDIILCSLEVPLNCVEMAAQVPCRRKKGRGRPRIILNPAPFPASGLPAELLARCHFMTPNKTEYEQLLSNAGKRKKEKETDPDPYFLVTLGVRGAMQVRSNERRKMFPAPKVRAVDTVGAGDCFNGCLAAALSEEEENEQGLEKAIRFAIVGASLKVTRYGAQAGMPHRREIRHSMKQ